MHTLILCLLQVVWKNIHFLMWDIGGQESLRSAWNTYYTNTEVLCCRVNVSKEKGDDTFIVFLLFLFKVNIVADVLGFY